MYFSAVNDIVSRYSSVFLDNIFPNEVKAFARGEHRGTLEPRLRTRTAEVEFWRETLARGNISLPWEIYLQTVYGYGALERTVAMNPKFGRAADRVYPAYFTAFFGLCEDARRQVYRFNAREAEQYDQLFSYIKCITAKHGLKKLDHKEDHGADESLVSCAVHQARSKGEPSAILTNDHDIGRIVVEALRRIKTPEVHVYYLSTLDVSQRAA